MKMLFIYPDIDFDTPGAGYKGEISLAIGYLSAILKKHGHIVKLIHIVNDIEKESLIGQIEEFHPDLIGFSTISQIFSYVRRYAGWIKERLDVPIIVGGAHPSLNPNETIVVENIDMICVGEGELSLLELCDNIQTMKPIDNIPSIWLKKDGAIKKNPVRALVENLDDLPMPDRDIFDIPNLNYHTNKKYPYTIIKASRGCPFNCSYCSNHKFRELYPNKDKMVRFHSVGRVIEEARRILEKTPDLKLFYFHDDIFPVYKNWFREFASEYKKEIGLPYRCKARVELMDEEFACLLKKSGCFRVQIGIESGNEEILKLLKRPVAAEKVFAAFRLCEKYGIQTQSFNMVGIPHEDSGKILDTIKINAKANPGVIITSIYYPLPNTELYNVCKEEKLLTGSEFVSMHSDSAIVLKDITPVKVKFFHRYFRVLVILYHFLFNLPLGISTSAVRLLDGILKNARLPHGFLIWIHDRYFKNVLLDRSYFVVEDKIFGGKKTKAVRRLK